MSQKKRAISGETIKIETFVVCDVQGAKSSDEKQARRKWNNDLLKNVQLFMSICEWVIVFL